MVMAMGVGLLGSHTIGLGIPYLFSCGCSLSHIFVPLAGVDLDFGHPEGPPEGVSFCSSV